MTKVTISSLAEEPEKPGIGVIAVYYADRLPAETLSSRSEEQLLGPQF